MAIAIPFIATALGATAVQAAVIAVGFAVTGISAKIDKAAANVFGEDLVKVATIAGMAYGALNGGFEVDGLGTDAVLAERGMAEAINLGDVASAELTAAAGDPMAAVQSANAADAAAGITQSAPQGMNLADMQSLNAMGPETGGLANSPAPVSTELSKVAATPTTAAPTAPTQTATAPTTSGAAAPNATVSKGVANTATSANAAANKAAGDITSPFFDRLKKMATGEYALTEGLKGVAGAYSSSKARQQQQEQFDKQWADMERMRNMGIPNWRQTQ